MTGKKLIRDKATPENRAFWLGVAASAEGVNAYPTWKKAGITLSDRFETYDKTDK